MVKNEGSSRFKGDIELLCGKDFNDMICSFRNFQKGRGRIGKPHYFRMFISQVGSNKGRLGNGKTLKLIENLPRNQPK